jgi:dTMP kinase
MAGMFFVLEGPDGAGKSSHCRALVDWLCDEGVDAVACADPGRTDAGMAIRQVLLDRRSKLDPVTELFLFGAARRQLWAEIILPSLRAGKHVVCDRFDLSTLVYQHRLFGHSRDLVESMSNIVTPELMSKSTTSELLEIRTIVLDASPQILIARKGDAKADRLEAKLESLASLRQAYLDEAKRSSNTTVLDASDSFQDVQARLRKYISHCLASRLV